METAQIANTTVSQEGFWQLLSRLFEKLTNVEAFMLIVVVLLCYFVYKSWDKIVKLFRDREKTAVKRTNEINEARAFATSIKNDLESYKAEHAAEHKNLNWEISEFKEYFEDQKKIREEQIKQGVKLDILLEGRIPKPRQPPYKET